jgi:hypothetical protein
MGSPTSPNDSPLREDLAFIRGQTNAEIANIERLFNRAVTTISWILGAAGLVLLFFGLATYQSLKDLVVTTTKSEMDRVVKQQIAEQLQRENVEKIANAVVTSRAEAFLRETISKQVSTEVSRMVKDLQPEINQIATRGTNRILAARFAQRRLTAVQREKIVTFLSSRRNKYLIHISPMENDPEESRYSKDITEALDAAHWGATLGSPYGYGGPSAFEIPEGVTGSIFLIVNDTQKPPPGVDDILEAFREAGLVVALVKSSEPLERLVTVPELVIGPK